MEQGDELLSRLRAAMAGYDDAVEKRMVGGRAFSVGGRMCCGVTSTGLMVRIDPADGAAVLAEPHVKPLMMGSKQVASFVVIDPAGIRSGEALARWVQRGVDAGTSPAPARSRRARSPAVLGRSAAERFADLADGFAESPGVSPPGQGGGRGFGANALRVDGAIFAMLSHDRLVVKLPRSRVTELLGTGAHEPFTAGKATAMKEWLTVADDDASWQPLAAEALAYVRESGTPARPRRR